MEKTKYLYIAFAPFFIFIFSLAFALVGYFDILKYDKIFPFVLVFMFLWFFYFMNRYEKW